MTDASWLLWSLAIIDYARVAIVRRLTRAPRAEQDPQIPTIIQQSPDDFK